MYHHNKLMKDLKIQSMTNKIVHIMQLQLL